MMAISGMHDKPCRFVDNQDVFILKKDIEIYLLSQDISWFRRGKLKRNFVMFPDPVSCFNGRIIDQDIAAPDQAAKDGSGMIGEAADKVMIKPQPRMTGRDCQ